METGKNNLATFKKLVRQCFLQVGDRVLALNLFTRYFNWDKSAFVMSHAKWRSIKRMESIYHIRPQLNEISAKTEKTNLNKLVVFMRLNVIYT